MNDFLLRCPGTWEGTTLTNGGLEVPAAELYLMLQTGRNEFGEPVPGGVNLGGDSEAFYRLSEYPDVQQGIFPGRIVLQLPGGSMSIENWNPMGPVMEAMQVFYNGHLITQNLLDLELNINADANIMSCFVRIYQPNWLIGDEIVEYNLI